jgi:cytochrome c5
MPRHLFLCITLSLLPTIVGCGEGKAQASTKTTAQYEQHCAACHEVGAANAPRRGDAHQWGKRLKKGEAHLVQSIKSGLVAMPPRGGCTTCTDDDYRALIHYMAQE